MLNSTFNTRQNSFAHYANRRFFAAEYGLNLSCFTGLPFGLSPIFSEKNQQVRKIPYKAEAGLCRFVHIKKTLVFLSGSMDNISRFSIENLK